MVLADSRIVLGKGSAVVEARSGEVKPGHLKPGNLKPG
jgi:hypothetical protein